MPAFTFTAAEVVEIRFQHSRGRLDVRAWADLKKCSVETVRRVARGDTGRHIAGIKAHPVYGGHQGQAPTFTPSETLPKLADLAEDPDEEAAAFASLARLQAALAEPVPGNPQASTAVSLLDELQAKAEPPPGKGATKLG